MTSKIVQTVLRTFQHYKLISANQTLIVGVSGGIDSLALIHILLQIRRELGIRLHIANLNHGIRGESADADTKFVQGLAIQWAVPYTLDMVDIPQLAKANGRGIEETARDARYDFLAKVAQEQQTSFVAVAHHADDQAETILMHLIRGSGLNGLRGMQLSAPMPRYPSLRLLRPLLGIQKTELEQYCRDKGLQPRHDETNDDVKYQRNYLRHEIAPRLKKINPQVVDALVRLGHSATMDDAYIVSQLEAIALPKAIMKQHQWAISLQDFHELPTSLQYRFIQLAFQRISIASVALHLNQITKILSWLPNASIGSQLDLGQGIRIRVDYEQLFIEHDSVQIDFDDYLLLPADTTEIVSSSSGSRILDLPMAISTYEPDTSEYANAIVLGLPEDAELCVRVRRTGDRFRPKGMDGKSKTLKHWMIDRKIPRQIRNQIPVLTINEEIIAILVGKKWHLAELSQYNLNGKKRRYLILG